MIGVFRDSNVRFRFSKYVFVLPPELDWRLDMISQNLKDMDEKLNVVMIA